MNSSNKPIVVGRSDETVDTCYESIAPLSAPAAKGKLSHPKYCLKDSQDSSNSPKVVKIAASNGVASKTDKRPTKSTATTSASPLQKPIPTKQLVALFFVVFFILLFSCLALFIYDFVQNNSETTKSSEITTTVAYKSVSTAQKDTQGNGIASASTLNQRSCEYRLKTSKEKDKCNIPNPNVELNTWQQLRDSILKYNWFQSVIQLFYPLELFSDVLGTIGLGTVSKLTNTPKNLLKKFYDEFFNITQFAREISNNQRPALEITSIKSNRLRVFINGELANLIRNLKFTNENLDNLSRRTSDLKIIFESIAHELEVIEGFRPIFKNWQYASCGIVQLANVLAYFQNQTVSIFYKNLHLLFTGFQEHTDNKLFTENLSQMNEIQNFVFHILRNIPILMRGMKDVDCMHLVHNFEGNITEAVHKFFKHSMTWT